MKSAIIFCSFFFLWCASGYAQGYFKLLEKPEKTYNYKIKRFKNGDLLLAGSALTGQTEEPDRGMFAIRMDACGKVLWSYLYQWHGNYLEFKDVEINADEEIILYGSAYEGFNELIALLKVDRYGKLVRYQQFQSGTVDHFTYSIHLQGNKILAYGLLLGWTSQKQGFIAVFNEGLEFQWGKRFEPFESTGQAIIDQDGNFLCLSGPYIIKLDEKGDLIWSYELHTALGVHPVAGPLETADGYIFEFYHNNLAFFFKMDKQGRFMWKSDQFAATKYGAAMTIQPNGDLYAVYSSPGSQQTYLCNILLDNLGNILQQGRFTTPAPLRTGYISTTFHEKGTLNILGNPDLFTTSFDQATGFLMQIHSGDFMGDCFQVQSISETTANDVTLIFSPISLEFTTADMPGTQVFDAKVKPLEKHFAETCQVNLTTLHTTDSVLACGESWQVALPGSDFSWQDGNTDNPRVLTSAGSYIASNNNCLAPVAHEYNLEREACRCKVFLPNSFSPNGDDINDRLDLFSNCAVQHLETQIFSRWGDLVYESTGGASASWDGRCAGEFCPPGLYVARIQYQLQDESGIVEQGSLQQGVMLVR